MRDEMRGLRERLGQYEIDENPPPATPTLNAEIERIKRELMESKMHKRSSMEKLGESFTRKKSFGS